MTMIDAILDEFEREAATTRRVLERVPEDKLSWKPHPKSFSLGQLAFHVANTPGTVSEMALLDTFSPRGFTQPEPANLTEILSTLENSVTGARSRLAGLSDARLLENWSFVVDGKPLMVVPRIGMIRSILLNHWYHHRGQLTVYLRQLDVPLPSVYGPTADENPFAM